MWVDLAHFNWAMIPSLRTWGREEENALFRMKLMTRGIRSAASLDKMVDDNSAYSSKR